MEQDNTPIESTKVTKEPKSSKKVIYTIIILLLVLGAIYFVVAREQAQKESNLSLSPTEVEQLSEAERIKVLEQQLASLEEEERLLTPESDKGDRFTTYIQLAEVRTALGKHQEALDALNKIQSERVGNTRLWMTYGLVYKNMGNNAEARTRVREALKLDSEIVDNWLFLFSVTSDLSREEQDAIYKEALLATANDVEIIEAYESFKAQAK